MFINPLIFYLAPKPLLQHKKKIIEFFPDITHVLLQQIPKLLLIYKINGVFRPMVLLTLSDNFKIQGRDYILKILHNLTTHLLGYGQSK